MSALSSRRTTFAFARLFPHELVEINSRWKFTDLMPVARWQANDADRRRRRRMCCGNRNMLQLDDRHFRLPQLLLLTFNSTACFFFNSTQANLYVLAMKRGLEGACVWAFLVCRCKPAGWRVNAILAAKLHRASVYGHWFYLGVFGSDNFKLIILITVSGVRAFRCDWQMENSAHRPHHKTLYTGELIGKFTATAFATR